MVNLEAHVKNVQKFGVPVVVALNRFISDTPEEIDVVLDAAKGWGARAALSDVWAKGGEGRRGGRAGDPGGAGRGKADFKPIYDVALPIKEKIETIAREIYGADGVDYSAAADKTIAQCEAMGLGDTPVCMAKTQYSLQRRPRPSSAARPDSGLPFATSTPSAGAGFVVALAGEIMTMPGLSKTPAAEAIRVHPDGTIEGLF